MPRSTSTGYRRDAVLLSGAVGVFAVSFGALATTAGLSVVQACAVSLLVFTGASQFAAVGVIAAGGSVGAALGSALLLAARNGAYGVALAPLLRDRPLAQRLLVAQLVIDETTAMATAQSDPRRARDAFRWTAASVFVSWNVGTLAGAFGGDAIGSPETFGLDAAFLAGFIALAAPHVRTRRGKVAAVTGGLIALVLTPVAPAGIPILAAALAVAPAMLFVRPGRA